MSCTSPLWIRNKHFVPTRTLSTKSRRKEWRTVDTIASELYEKPYELARLYIPVPCGKCAECLRAERNSWFVRLDRELARSRALGQQSVFLTLTVSPENYESAVESPSSFVRKFFEAIRHKYGNSIKHFLVQEIGEKGRLHFHGMLFGFDVPYRGIHDIARRFGFCWLAPATARRARYVVKYILKDMGDLPVRFQFPIYRRKFVSAGVGDYLGTMPKPSFLTKTWTFTDFKTGIQYVYKIPRYYDKELSPEDKDRRHMAVAFWMAPLVLPRSVSDDLRQAYKDMLPENVVKFSESFIERLTINKNYRQWQARLKSAIMSMATAAMTLPSRLPSPPPLACSIRQKLSSLMPANGLNCRLAL